MDPRSVKTINDLFALIVERNHPRAVLNNPGLLQPSWTPLSSADIYSDVLSVARTLQSWGINRGERVSILGENRYEWAVADFACLALGIVDVPIYPTLTADQTAFILNDAGVRAIFVSTAEQLQKILSIRAQTGLEKIILMDRPSAALPAGIIAMHDLIGRGPVARDAQFDAATRAVAPEDLATIIYTSGTTGTPKGVMLTHGNLASNLVHSLEVFGIDQRDLALSFLPLSHITARHTDYAMYQYGVTVAYCTDIHRIAEVMLQLRPTFFVSVPRLYEKVRIEVERKTSSGLKRKFYEWALGVGRKHAAEVMSGRRPTSLSWKLAHALVFSKIEAGFGGRGRIFISGGAPLGRELAEWYAFVGIRVYEGYGLTETSPVVALNNPRAYKLGTVGKPLPNVECRIAEDGELLVRGPSVFHGYWKKPEETRAAFEDGWFHTGDMGSIDADGFLSITDRKKDLIKTSGGKFVAPQPLENTLKLNPMVAYAAVIGDKRRFCSVIIAPNFPALEEWAHAQGITFSSREELVQDAKTRAFYENLVDALNLNLAQYEKLKRVLLVPDEFSIATGELTPTLKLKRRVLEDRYRTLIDEMYATAVAPAAVPSI